MIMLVDGLGYLEHLIEEYGKDAKLFEVIHDIKRREAERYANSEAWKEWKEKNAN